MNTIDIESRAKEYLEAFEARDMDRCVSFFAPDATIKFQNSAYSGIDAVREWHQERFDADLRMIRLDGISTSGDSVTVEGAATSKRLRAWKLDSVEGAITAQFDSDLIRELSFGVRLGFW